MSLLIILLLLFILSCASTFFYAIGEWEIAGNITGVLTVALGLIIFILENKGG